MRSPVTLAASLIYRSWQLLAQFSSRGKWQRLRIAAKRYDSSVPAVFTRLIRLFFTGRFLPEEALTLGLGDPRQPVDEHRNHFSKERLHGLETSINAPDRAVCRDKLLFYTYCQHYGLPTPELYAVLSTFGSRREDGALLATDADWQAFARTTLPADTIVKPRGGNMGRGIHAMGTGADNPTAEQAAAFVRDLRSAPQAGEDYLVQERMFGHPEIARLTGVKSVSTIRIFTLIAGDKPPEIYGAYFRVIIGDTITDNVSDYKTGKYSGNIIAAPDMATGRIEWAWQPYTDGVGGRYVEDHPRTGVALPGFQIPDWQDVRQLVTRAAPWFMPLRFIGWDVAITPRGPLLIEANELPHNGLMGEWVIKLRAALEAERDRLAVPRR